jgi:ABC-type nickel/cobalt efflux system permease component RcnA
MAGFLPSICEFCGSGYGDLSTGNVASHLIGAAHSQLLDTLKQASDDLAQGHLGASLAFLLLAGASYGSLHAIGPGHGKFAIAGYALGAGKNVPLLRVVAGAGLAHVAGAALILAFASVPALASGGALPVESWARPIQGVTYAVLAIIGVWLIMRAMRGAHHHSLAHTAHMRPASQWTLGATVGAPPCTGSIIAAAFAIGHQAIALGFVTIFAIAAGMAATLGAVGWSMRAFKSTTLAHVSTNTELWWRAFEALGGCLLLLTGAVFAYASF